MTYRELLDAYKNGALDEKTKRAVIEDIEKQDAISEYLFEQELSTQTNFSGQEENDAEEAEAGRLTALVQKAVRKTLMKAGLVTGALVLVIVAFCAFVLPRLTDYFYYRPDKIVYQDPEDEYRASGQMQLDLGTWTELYLPGYYRPFVSVDSEGWGRYNLSVPQVVSANGQFRTVNGRLVRNKLIWYQTDTLCLPAANAFVAPEEIEGGFYIWDEQTQKREGVWGDAESQKWNLSRMDEDQWYVCYLSLDRVMDYSDFYSWYEELELKDVHSPWVSVYAETENGGKLGVNPGFLIGSAGLGTFYDREKYPDLWPVDFENDYDPSDEAQMTRHFTSLLQYQLDNPEFSRIMDAPMTADPVTLKQIKNAVERDGLRTYGFSVTAQKETLQRLFEEPAVAHIYAEPLR